ncbi:GNAT family N-acetyltransferase [Liquorilactobacillus oeni]|uniref:Putative acetyltransferase (Putative) n=1 Tax=Liquorilactobacillus oeni DSM 19972 TaxID=1423777 RepID=A0A0R1MBS4_9LACO|nr:GNAT family N-acetyltransferase [Liquorilactobacillus oeni]KRL05345.1 putative acetyltransferase (putative) [Liquorilactobacillus oeni DSM 19972]
MEITTVTPKDIDQIIAIEQAGFSAAEAGTRIQYLDRIAHFAGTFLVARENSAAIGFVCGPAVQESELSDWMYERAVDNLPFGGNQMILTIAVAPQWRRKHIGSHLLAALEETARTKGRKSIVLTCLQSRIRFYEHNGYCNTGISSSQHAAEIWYTMKKSIQAPLKDKYYGTKVEVNKPLSYLKK